MRIHTSVVVALCAATLSLPALAQTSKPALTVYTYNSFTGKYGPGPALKKGFEAVCNCTVNFVSFEGVGVLQNRLLLEGAKDNKADVVIGLDQNDVKTFKGKGFFAQHKGQLPALNLPFKWNAHTYVPYDYSQFAFIYDSQKLKNPPTTFKAFLADKNIRVIYQDPRTSAVGQGLLVWVNQVFKHHTKKAWEQLASHTVTVGKGWSASYGAFLKGESDVALSYVSSPIYHILFDKTDRYKALVFKEGLPYQVELAAITKASKHKKLGSEFLRYLLTPEAQKTLVTTNIMFPVVKNVDLPVLKQVQPVKALPLLEPTQKTLKHWTNEWEDAVTQ